MPRKRNATNAGTEPGTLEAPTRPPASRSFRVRLGDDPDAPELTIEPGRFARAVKHASTRGNVVPFKGAFRVRSQSGGGSYIVEQRHGLWECDCEDWAPLRPCVHVLTVLLRERILPYPDEEAEATTRPAGGITDWAAYRKAEEAIPRVLPRLARRLFEGLPDTERRGPGRPPVPQADSLLCALMWSIAQKNARQEQETRDRLLADGLLSRRVAGNDVSRTLTDPKTTAQLEEALRATRLPFSMVDDDGTPFLLSAVGDTFAVDSTGFTPSRRGHYNTEKHGAEKPGPLPWLKCHLMISTKAHLITGARITSNTGEGTGDTSQFEPVFRDTAEAFPVAAVVGDGAYANRKNVTLVRDAGASPFFPPRADTITKQHTASGWADMVAFFIMRRAEFDAIYHTRSNVESVNSAIKRRFGETLRSRSVTSRTNELLCKLIAYNLTVLVQQLHFLQVAEEWLDRIL